MEKNQKIEIARSFSRKLNLQNYETCDLFCSAKAEVDFKDAEEMSNDLYKLCLNEVRKSAQSYLIEREKFNNKK